MSGEAEVVANGDEPAIGMVLEVEPVSLARPLAATKPNSVAIPGIRVPAWTAGMTREIASDDCVGIHHFRHPGRECRDPDAREGRNYP